MSDAFDEYVAHFRHSTLQKMVDSAYVMQLVPKEDSFDVKFATELGAAIMLDKPIMAVVMPGATVPSKLIQIADVIVTADLDTEDGREEVARAAKDFARRFV